MSKPPRDGPSHHLLNHLQLQTKKDAVGERGGRLQEVMGKVSYKGRLFCRFKSGFLHLQELLVIYLVFI